MFNKDTLLGAVRAKFPETFKSWDGFMTSVMANDREGLDPVIIVGLYNKPTPETPANLHRAFRLDVKNESMESGDEKLVDDEMKRIYPEVYAKLDAECHEGVVEAEEQPELSDEEEIASNSDRGMFLRQDMEAQNGSEIKE